MAGGGAGLFGEPALDLADLMRCDGDGRGRINILAADTLMAAPGLYATFLLWLLSELFEELPEVGDGACGAPRAGAGVHGRRLPGAVGLRLARPGL